MFVRFFQFFDQLRRLRMWKMQLLDEHHLFIKYTSEDVVTLRVTDPSQVDNTHTHTHRSVHVNSSLCALLFCSPGFLRLSFVVLAVQHEFLLQVSEDTFVPRILFSPGFIYDDKRQI